MALRKYNPKKITGSFTGSVGGRPFAVAFSGYMDGSFVSAEYDEDAVSEHVGSQGETTIVLNANKKAACTVTLVQGSPANDLLSVLVPDADLNYLPVGVLSFTDLNGTTVIASSEAWIRKTAPIEFGKEVTGRVWVLGMSDAKIHVGGAADF